MEATAGGTVHAVGVDFSARFAVPRVRVYHRDPAPPHAFPRPSESTIDSEIAHWVLTLPIGVDPLGKRATWSAIFAPGRCIEQGASLPSELRSKLESARGGDASYVIRPTATQWDYLDGGDTERAFLYTLTAPSEDERRT